MEISTRRWGWNLLGAVAVAALVWVLLPRYAPPAVANLVDPADPVWRIAITVLLLGLVALAEAWRLRRPKRRHQRLLKALAEHAGGDTGSSADGSHPAWRHSIKHCLLASCEARRSRGQAGYLQQLRWYLVVGTSADDTEALLRSAAAATSTLHPSAQYPIDGGGSSRGLRWWFIGDAVYLEVKRPAAVDRVCACACACAAAATDTRAIFHELGDAVRSTLWSGLFGVLAKARHGRAMDAVLLVSPMGHQIGSDAVGISFDALDAGARSALKLNNDAPLIAICTQADTLPGGSEFLASLNTSDAAEALGVVYRHGDSDGFGAGVEHIARGLRQRLPEAMAGYSDPATRSAILAFPRRFSEAAHELGKQLAELPDRCGGGKNNPVSLFFCGGVDAAPNAVAATGTASHLRRDLFSGGLFGRFLASAEPRLRSVGGRPLWLRGGRYLPNFALAFIALVMSALWVDDYLRLDATVGRVADDFSRSAQLGSSLSGGVGGSKATLALLQRLQGAEADLNAQLMTRPAIGGESLHRVRLAAAQAHRRSVKQQLLPLVTARLEQQLRSPWLSATTTARSVEVYRMLGGHRQLDAELLQAWARAHLTTGGSELNHALAGHLEVLDGRSSVVLPIQPKLLGGVSARLAAAGS